MVSRPIGTHTHPALLQAIVFALVLITLVIVGCGDDSGDTPTGPIEPAAAAAIWKLPPDLTELVALDQVIKISFDRPLEQEELDATTFQINGVEAGRVSLENFSSHSWVTIDPAQPLAIHKYYEVSVEPNGARGLASLSWQFATHPGAAGEIWERIDTPTSEDLRVVIELNSGMYAAGGGGAFVFSSDNTRGQWTQSAGIGDPTPQTETILKLWDGGTLFAAVTADGTLYRGQAWGEYMDVWETDPDHYIRAMYGVTTVLGGSLRSEPTMGMVTSGPTGVTALTGTNRIIRDVVWAHDGQQYYLAVGDNGTVFYSRDLEQWTDVLYAPAYGSLRAVVGGIAGQANPQYSPLNVAVGDEIVWSADGQSWLRASAPQAIVLHDVDYDQFPLDSQQYIAVGDNGLILASPDGKVWSSLDTGLDLVGVDLYSLRTSLTRWVIVGEAGIVISTPPAHLEFP